MSHPEIIYFSLEVEFLKETFHGIADGEPEWPPSPYRLYQSLVSAGKRLSKDSSSINESLQWLEKQPPPIILAAKIYATKNKKIYVPGNKDYKRGTRNEEKKFTKQFIDSPYTVKYIWEITSESQSYAPRIHDIAKYVPYLGKSLDRVIIRHNIEPFFPNISKDVEEWHPSDIANPMIRLAIPSEGSLKTLEDAYDLNTVKVSNLRPKFTGYSKRSEHPKRQFAAFRLSDAFKISGLKSCIVASQLREMVCQEMNRRDFEEQFPHISSEKYLAGHIAKSQNASPRFAYAALPTAGYEYSDGYIRRVLIAEEHGGPKVLAKWAENRLLGQNLINKNREELCFMEELPYTDNVLRKYTGQSKTWVSATPVLLPGFANKIKTREDIAIRTLTFHGFKPEDIVSIKCQPEPFVQGSSYSGKYTTLNRQGNWPIQHVKVEFANEVRGPLMLGVGGYAGLGVMICQN